MTTDDSRNTVTWRLNSARAEIVQALYYLEPTHTEESAVLGCALNALGYLTGRPVAIADLALDARCSRCHDPRKGHHCADDRGEPLDLAAVLLRDARDSLALIGEDASYIDRLAAADPRLLVADAACDGSVVDAVEWIVRAIAEVRDHGRARYLAWAIARDCMDIATLADADAWLTPQSQHPGPHRRTGDYTDPLIAVPSDQVGDRPRIWCSGTEADAQRAIASGTIGRGHLHADPPGGAAPWAIVAA